MQSILSKTLTALAILLCNATPVMAATYNGFVDDLISHRFDTGLHDLAFPRAAPANSPVSGRGVGPGGGGVSELYSLRGTHRGDDNIEIWFLQQGDAEGASAFPGMPGAGGAASNSLLESYHLSLMSLSGENNNNGGTTKSLTAALDDKSNPDPAIPAVPVPAAFWLFGSALVGFIGISRRTRI